MATIDTRTAYTPNAFFAGLSGVFRRTGARKIVECDGAFSSVLTRLYLQSEALWYTSHISYVHKELKSKLNCILYSVNFGMLRQ